MRQNSSSSNDGRYLNDDELARRLGTSSSSGSYGSSEDLNSATPLKKPNGTGSTGKPDVLFLFSQPLVVLAEDGGVFPADTKDSQEHTELIGALKDLVNLKFSKRPLNMENLEFLGIFVGEAAGGRDQGVLRQRS